MPDQVYDWLEAFDRFMEGTSFAEWMLLTLLTSAGSWGLLLLHEAGHAIAVRARGLPLRKLKVGHAANVVVSVGSFRMELGRLLGKADVGGYVLYDSERATLRDALMIAAAGPAANAVGAGVTLWLAVSPVSSGLAEALMWLLTATGVEMCVANLRMRGDPRDMTTWSDGHWIRFASWALRTPEATAPFRFDPNEGTSVPPPGAPSAS